MTEIMIEGVFSSKLNKEEFQIKFEKFLKENKVEFEGFIAKVDGEKLRAVKK